MTRLFEQSQLLTASTAKYTTTAIGLSHGGILYHGRGCGCGSIERNLVFTFRTVTTTFLTSTFGTAYQAEKHQSYLSMFIQAFSQLVIG